MEAAPAGGPTVVLSRYEEIREALFAADLSRTFDRRSWAEGNIRDGVVSVQHGPVHRARRRVENSQFRPDRLRLYERELFPGVLATWTDRIVEDGRTDLFALGELLSVVLAARRAGIDHDPDSRAQLEELVEFVDVFSQGSAILDAKDPEAVRTLYRRTMLAFGERYVAPSRAPREAAIARVRAGELAEEELPHDILTVLLLHRDDPAMELDDGRLVREVATYLQGGTHTSSQTLVNGVDLILPLAERDPGIWDRIAGDPAFAQRCVHETLRLRPTTPKIKRHAEADLVVAGTAIPAGSTVVLDALAANRDPRLFGERPDAFDPDRRVDPSVARWGLSFGAGAHQCPGRSVAGGFPAPAPDATADEEHLFGLSALMLREIARRGVRPDPDRSPERDTRTERHTRWASYPVRIGPRPLA
ncbi:MAG: cytochrome P450 [Chloroflexota bacterium]